MLFFVKGKKSIPANFLKDVVYSTAPDKTLHEWEQSPTEAEHVIKALTISRNQIVLDPFMGAGTFGIAALKCRRIFMGIEINPKTYVGAEAKLLKASDHFTKRP
jgi:DNA modification methylase